MNQEEARFLRIRRYREEQIGQLHDCERNAAIRYDSAPSVESYEEMNMKRGVGWRIAGEHFMHRIDRDMPPFWDKNKTHEDRDRAINSFLNLPQVRRAFVMAHDMEKKEMDAMHEADWYVFKTTPALPQNSASPLEALYKE